MPKLDLSPPGMEPVNGPTLPPAETQTTEEGFVYGHAPKPPRSQPPDIVGMMKAAGIPGPTEGGLPFSLEWYRGAKDRQAAREVERDELLVTKNEFRQSWANILNHSLEECSYQVDKIVQEPQPLGALAELLARTAHERPTHVDRIEELRRRLAKAKEEKERLNRELGDAREGLRAVEDDVHRKKVEGDAAEEERIRLEKEERERKAKARRALERNEALLRGEELPPTPSDGDEDAEQAVSAEGEEEGDEQPGSAPTLLLGSPGLSTDLFGTGLPPTPGAVRGGLGATLPPIVDPPAPPPLG